VERTSEPVVIGVVTGTHGVRGTLRVRPTGSGRHLREGAKPLVAGHRMRILRARSTPRGFLVDLEGVENRSAAAALGGAELVLDRSELDTPEEGEFYVADLVGLDAISDDGEVVGRVEETLETPAHEILVIRAQDGSGQTYVPFTLEHVPEVDLERRRVLIRPPEG
jgi:16S rRNA processing protein RimM